MFIIFVFVCLESWSGLFVGSIHPLSFIFKTAGSFVVCAITMSGSILCRTVVVLTTTPNHSPIANGAFVAPVAFHNVLINQLESSESWSVSSFINLSIVTTSTKPSKCFFTYLICDHFESWIEFMLR